jgi:hypothetical protein
MGRQLASGGLARMNQAGQARYEMSSSQQLH